MSENPYDNNNSVEDSSGKGCVNPLAIGLGCVVIPGLVFLFLLPAQRRARVPAQRTHCKNNLKQLMHAMHDFHDFHDFHDVYGHFPPAFTVDDAGNQLHSWRTLLLPYLEQQALYETTDLTKPS